MDLYYAPIQMREDLTVQHHLEDRDPEFQEALKRVITLMGEYACEEYELYDSIVYRRNRDTRNSMFGSGTQGALGVDAHVPLSYLWATGFSLPNDAFDSAARKEIEALCVDFEKRFLEQYPEAREYYDPDGDVAIHEALSQQESGLLAQKWESNEDEYLFQEDDVAVIRIGVFYFSDEGELPNLEFWAQGHLGHGSGFANGPRQKTFKLGESKGLATDNNAVWELSADLFQQIFDVAPELGIDWSRRD